MSSRSRLVTAVVLVSLMLWCPPATRVGATSGRVQQIQSRKVLEIGRGQIIKLVPQPGGKLLAVASGAGLWIYQVDTLRLINPLLTDQAVLGLSWSPNGKSFVSLTSTGSVDVWDALSLKRKSGFVVDGTVTPVDVAWAPDSRWIALLTTEPLASKSVADVHSTILVWNAQTQKEAL